MMTVNPNDTFSVEFLQTQSLQELHHLWSLCLAQETKLTPHAWFQSISPEEVVLSSHPSRPLPLGSELAKACVGQAFDRLSVLFDSKTHEDCLFALWPEIKYRWSVGAIPIHWLKAEQHPKAKLLAS